jgi:ankyrin repeat protein
MVAAAGGHYDVLTALLKAKAEPNNKNKASGTALHEAAAIANAKVVGQV